jgi:CheY-like chemotaxis protein
VNGAAPVERAWTFEHSILVVDGDPVSRRFVELAFAAHRTVLVEAVAEGRAALEVLQTVTVDLVLCETSLPDMGWRDLLGALQRSAGHTAPPLLVLSADGRTSTKVAALEAGAVDYVTKPCPREELVARCLAVVGRQRRQRDAFNQRNYSLAGSFDALPFPDLMALLEVGRRSGVVDVVTDGGAGVVALKDGRVTHAQFGNLRGPDAFTRYLAARKGTFELAAGSSPVEASMDESVTALLMEGAKRLDEQRRDHPARPEASGWTPPRPSRVPPSMVADVAPREARARLIGDLRDGFTLGTLQARTAAELASWTESLDAPQGFHFWLMADPAAGARGFLGLSAPPGERWLVSAMRAEAICLGVSFEGRDGLALDGVLLDARCPAAFQRALRRRPSLAIVAPPRGDLLTLGARGQAEIFSLVGWARPTVILGIGNAATLRALQDLPGLRGGDSLMATMTAELGQGRADLRRALITGIELWGRLEGPTK